MASTSRYATPARRSASTRSAPVTYTRPASRAALEVASNARWTSAITTITYTNGTSSVSITTSSSTTAAPRSPAA